MHLSFKYIIALGSLITLSATASDSKDWIRWAGPHNNFHVASGKLAETWPESGPEELWSRPMGGGYSAILSQGNVLYTAYRAEESDVVVSIDSATGKTLWEYIYEAPPLEGQQTSYGTGPNATPLIMGNHLYTLSFTGILHCLNKNTGKVVWKHNLIDEYGGQSPSFGYSASPMPYKDMVIVLCGGEKVGAIGFDPKSGDVRWKSDPIMISYASPITVKIADEIQLVFMDPKGVTGVSLDSGKILWQEDLQNRYDTQAGMPLYGDDGLLFVSTQVDSGSKTLRIGKDGDNYKVETVAASKDFGIFYNNPVRSGDIIFGSYNKHLCAYNLKTGTVLWKERGYSNVTLLKAGDKFIMLDELGTLYLTTMNQEGLTIHAQKKILERSAWTVPTLVGNKLYLRDTKTIKALQL